MRVGHGLYLPNPTLEIARGEAWIPLFDYLELEHLFAALKPEGALAERWLRKLEARTREAVATANGTDTASPVDAPAH